MRIYLSALMMLVLSSVQAQTIELVKEVNPGFVSSLFFSPVRLGDEIIYGNVDPEFGSELWRTDGTAEGTDIVLDIQPNLLVSSFCFPNPMISNGDLMFLCANDGINITLWVANAQDGSVEKILIDGMDAVLPEFFHPLGDKMVFAGTRQQYGIEFYISDGTEEGTFMLKDIYEGSISSAPNFFPEIQYFEFDGKLVFRANDGIHGYELWITDGTQDGTKMIMDFNASSQSSSYGEDYAALEEKLFFSLFNQNTMSYEIWVYNSSTEQAEKLNDVVVSEDIAQTELLGAFNGKVYFTGSVGTAHFLWETDGSSEGTTAIFEFDEPLSAFEPSNLVGIQNDYLVFSTISNEETEFWRTDGTAGGTFKLGDPDSALSSLNTLFTCNLGNKMLLRCYGSNGEDQMWVTDGTITGTKKLADVRVAYLNDFSQDQHVPYEEKIIDGVLYFGGITDVAGYELWRTDGTVDGTFMVEDFIPGPGSFGPKSIIRLGNQVLFEGNTPETGYELYRLAVEPNANNELVHEDRSIVLSPNPSSGLFKVEWSDKDRHYKGEIMDVQGRVVWSKDSLSSGKYQEVDLEAGVYILVLSNERSYYSRKLIIN
jgi:ELWxxDGT repeat protein